MSSFNWMDKIVLVMKNDGSKKYFTIEKDILPQIEIDHPDIINELGYDKIQKKLEKILASSPQFLPHSTIKNSYALKKAQDSPIPTDVSESKSKSSEKKTSSKKKKPQSLWCHQCKQKHNEILYCSKYYSGSCTKKYCKGCIERHYSENYAELNKEDWVCLFCRNLCVCAFCRRKRGENVPKKIFNKRKTKNSSKDKEKDTIPLSPPLKKRKKNKIKEIEAEMNDILTSPPVVLRSVKQEEFIVEKVEIKKERVEVKKEKVEIKEYYKPIEHNMETNIESCSNTSKFNEDIPYLSITLAQLMERRLINIGDKLVLIRDGIYTGLILKNGYIKLELTSKLVENLPSFTESCGIKYSQACMDIIYCNGRKLKDYIEIYYQMIHDNNMSYGIIANTSNYSCVYNSHDYFGDDQMIINLDGLDMMHDYGFDESVCSGSSGKNHCEEKLIPCNSHEILNHDFNFGHMMFFENGHIFEDFV